MKRNHKENISKNGEGEEIEKEDIYSFITSMKGIVAPIEKRFVEQMLFRLKPRAAFTLVEECYLADPAGFKKRGIMPLREVADTC